MPEVLGKTKVGIEKQKHWPKAGSSGPNAQSSGARTTEADGFLRV